MTFFQVYQGVCNKTGNKVAIKAMKPPGPEDHEVKQVCGVQCVLILM